MVKGLAFKPNTLTTTVAPAHLQPAPLPLSFQHFFSVAKSKLWHSLLYWCQPVVIELFLVSFAFVAFEITMGLGRHTMRYHRGQYHGKLGYLQAFSALCIDVWSSWVFGLGVLLAFWVFGILFFQGAGIRGPSDAGGSCTSGCAASGKPLCSFKPLLRGALIWMPF